MWEDKGPSFVKMNKYQYLKAGHNELKVLQRGDSTFRRRTQKEE